MGWIGCAIWQVTSKRLPQFFFHIFKIFFKKEPTNHNRPHIFDAYYFCYRWCGSVKLVENHPKLDVQLTKDLTQNILVLLHASVFLITLKMNKLQRVSMFSVGSNKFHLLTDKWKYSKPLRYVIKCPQKMLHSSKLHSVRLMLFSVAYKKITLLEVIKCPKKYCTAQICTA